jgi:hypothetical protein
MMLLLWLLQEESGSTGASLKPLLETLKPHISPTDYLILTAIMSAITAVVSILAKGWIEESIKDRFKKEIEAYKLTLAKDLEDYKREIDRREQAAKVARVLALVKSGTEANIIEANQLSWEMSLWLPADTATKLARVLAKAPDAPNRTRLLLDVRRILLKLDKDDLDEVDIATF